MAKHYEVINETKTVNANMKLLNEDDLKVLKNYVAIGYSINPVEPKKKKVKIPTEDEKLLNPYSAINIQKYLEEEGGTYTDKENPENEYNGKRCIDIYWELHNKKLKNGAVYKDDSDDGKHKKGDARVKGHINTLKWFKKTFKDYENSDWVKKTLEEAKKKIEEKKKEEESSKK